MCGIIGKFLQQASRRPRNGGFAVQNFLVGHIGAIHGFVSAVVGLHYRAVQANPGKDTFAARIAQDLRIESYIGVRGRLSPHWSGGHGDVGADLEFVTQQAVQGMVVHE